jgi:deazaflavin-dependent oxidoreductase (nitroreductase family)
MSGPSDYNQAIIETFRANGGKVPGWDRMLLLTTTGAKTGKQRTHPLVYSNDGDRLVIAASKGGAPTNPSWYANLLANPIVTVELGPERFQARATAVTDSAERDRLYAHHAELMPGFAEYEKKTARKIPVVLLERTS